MRSVKQPSQITLNPGIGYLLTVLVVRMAGDRPAAIGGCATLRMFESVVIRGTRNPANAQHS